MSCYLTKSLQIWRGWYSGVDRITSLMTKEAWVDITKGWDKATSSKQCLCTFRNVYLNNIWIPYCMGNDFPRTIFNCAYYNHVFWTIPFVRISEFSNQRHQINCISKLRGIWESMSTTYNWMLELAWLKLNEICFSTSLGKPKWLNCRWLIRHVQWELANRGNMSRVWSNNRCWGTAKNTGKEIAHPST